MRSRENVACYDSSGRMKEMDSSPRSRKIALERIAPIQVNISKDGNECQQSGEQSVLRQGRLEVAISGLMQTSQRNVE